MAALFHSIPLLIKFTRAAFESMDPSFEHAARNLGASEWKVFWRVTVPLARRSIFAAAAWPSPVAGRLRNHHDDRRQHPRPDANLGGRDLRRRGIGQRALAGALVLAISAVASPIYLTNRLEPGTGQPRPG